jgi:hypothetical protein
MEFTDAQGTHRFEFTTCPSGLLRALALRTIDPFRASP